MFTAILVYLFIYQLHHSLVLDQLDGWTKPSYIELNSWNYFPHWRFNTYYKARAHKKSSSMLEFRWKLHILIDLAALIPNITFLFDSDQVSMEKSSKYWEFQKHMKFGLSLENLRFHPLPFTAAFWILHIWIPHQKLSLIMYFWII